jgi:lipoprotein-anchoring transpeptidase ErfK/SrfK
MSPLVQSFRTCVPALAGLLLALSATAASAAVTVRIDNSSQRMRVYVDGGLAHAWPVSTARRGYRTPAGHYRVQRMERMWYSRKYDNTPMPYALFFRGGYAIHGTYSVRQLGRPASHGCVRLSPAHASTLFALVRQHGGARVVVTNGSPESYARLRGRRAGARKPIHPAGADAPD